MFLKVLEGKMGVEEWEKEALEFAKVSRDLGIQRSESNMFNMAKSPEEAEEAQRRVERASKSRV